jgi:hypothetical protein
MVEALGADEHATLGSFELRINGRKGNIPPPSHAPMPIADTVI